MIPLEQRASRERRLSRMREHPTFRSGGALVEAPLRLAPIGAHVDHQGGETCGWSIDRTILLGYRRRTDGVVRVSSTTFPGVAEFTLGAVPEAEPGEWTSYVRGMALALEKRARESGIDCSPLGFEGVIDGEMPVGGLSSSAAILLAFLGAYLGEERFRSIPNTGLADLVLWSENEYLGLQNGILDQTVILSGAPKHLVHLDVANRMTSLVPGGDFGGPWEILVVYSGLSRSLVKSPFNERVRELREAARLLLERAGLPPVESPILRMVPPDVFERELELLPDPFRKRARHYRTEQIRVTQGVEAWRGGDIESFGRCILESGSSSIRNYESGSPELQTLYELLASESGVYGTRFCGGGFKGCCLAVIDPSRRESILERVGGRYRDRHPEAATAASAHRVTSAGSITFEEVLP